MPSNIQSRCLMQRRNRGASVNRGPHAVALSPKGRQPKDIAMKSITILALPGNAFAGDAAYKCVGAGGSAYRIRPCPGSSISIVPVIGSAGGYAIVPGSVRQEEAGRSQACQSAQEKESNTRPRCQPRSPDFIGLCEQSGSRHLGAMPLIEQDSWKRITFELPAPWGDACAGGVEVFCMFVQRIFHQFRKYLQL